MVRFLRTDWSDGTMRYDRDKSVLLPDYSVVKVVQFIPVTFEQRLLQWFSL